MLVPWRALTARKTTIAWAILAAVGGTTACRKAAPRLPQPIQVREWEIPWENAFPSDMALDGRGRVWFTDRLTHVIGRFDPETEEFVSMPTPSKGGTPYGMVRGPDGGIWFGESQLGKLGRVDPETGAMEEYQVGGGQFTGGPHLLAVSGGEIWFTMRESRAYGALDVATGEVRLWRTPPVTGGREVPDSAIDRYRPEPYGIATGPDGRVWVGVMGGWRLYEIEPKSGVMREHDLSIPLPDSVLNRYASGRTAEERARIAMSMRSRGVARRLAVDRAGGVWISDFGRSRVVRFDPRNSAQEAFESLQQPSEPYGIALSRDGVVWYGEKRNDRLVGLNPSTGERVSVGVSAGATIRHVLVDDERGRIWLPLSDRGRIGMVEVGAR
jgi:virginiamycin B lyase